jgi:hypothetical protein
VNRWSLAVLVVLATLFVAPAPSALACSCSIQSPCEAYGEADAIFVGLVTRGGDGEGAGRYHFSVEESFKGASSRTVPVATAMRGTSCEMGLTVGQRYLVYAYQDEETGELVTGLCTRTCRIERASDDLAYLRGRAAGRRGGVISGTVTHGDGEQPRPGHRVTLGGAGVRRSAKTDANGSYAFDGLPSGTYRVRADVPARHRSDEDEDPIELEPDGCARANFVIRPDTRVQGRVLDASGVPAPGVRVELVPAGETGWVPGVEGETTDDDGVFRFDELAPGRYVLGVNGNEAPNARYPYAPIFYPSSTDRSGAAVLEVVEGEAFEGLELHLEPPLAERMVTGIVTWPDGSPAASVYISLKDEEFQTAVGGSGVVTDAAGAFVIRALTGRSYYVWTLFDRGREQYHAEPVAVGAGNETVAVGIVLTEEGPNCGRCHP